MRKRAFDIVVAGLALVLSLPAWPLIALAVVLDDGLPVLFRAERVGRHGRPFTLLKFRTMRVGSTGPAVTASGDERVTRVGRFLRTWKLDELPQLVNVLRGEMSLVGPRPEAAQYVALYTDEQRHVLDVRPGITSPAVVAYRHEERLLVDRDRPAEVVYVEEVMPAKLALDLAYVRAASLRTDLGVLAATVRAVLRGG